jgi:hypothetical protein
MINAEGMIVHTDISELEDGSYLINKYVPVRRVTITEIKDLDRFVWVSMKLGDWVCYDDCNHEKILKSTPSKYRTFIKSTFYSVNNLSFDFIGDCEEKSIANWYNLVKEIQKFKGHIENKSIFLKMIDFKQMSCNNEVNIGFKTINKSQECFFELIDGQDYKIELLQHYPYEHSITDLKMHFDTDDEKIVAFPPYAEVHGKYDVIKFLFHTRGNPNKTYTYLHLDLNSNEYLVTKTALSLRIKGSYVRYVFVFFLLFLALIVSDLKDFSITSILGKFISSILFTIITKYMYR